MDTISYETIAFLMSMSFLAAFLDACVGGGGLISVPALMALGLPPSIVLGTNKMASSIGAAAGVLNYARSGKIDFKSIKSIIPLVFIGSFLGTLTVRQVSSEFLRPFVVVMLVVITIYTIMRKDWGEYGHYKGAFSEKKLIPIIILFVLGFYDGFFGPGTGSFMLFTFLLMGYDFVGSAANARMLNFVSNITAAVTFFAFGLYKIEYVIIMAVMMVPGAYAGSYMALKKGTKYVRPLFIIVSMFLIGKQIIDLLK